MSSARTNAEPTATAPAAAPIDEGAFHQLFELSLDPMCMIGFDGRLRMVNPECTRLLGHSYDELVGEHCLRFIHPADREATEHVLRRLAEGERVVDFEARGLCKDGRIVRVAWRGQASAERGLIYAVGRDVTEQRRQRDALEASERRFREAVVNAPIPVMVHAEDGQILHVSRGLIEMTGYRPDQLRTVSRWVELAFRSQPHQVMELVRKNFKEDAAGQDAWELPVHLANGAVRHWLISAAPLGRLPDGRKARIMRAMDITERKQAERDRARLAEMVEATSDFVGLSTVDGETLYINRAGRRMIGLDAEASVWGRPISAYHPTWAWKRLLDEAIPTALRDGIWSGQTALLAADGTERPVSQVVTAHFDDAGHPSHLSTIARDMTEWHRAARLESERNHLRQAIDAHERILRAVGHELRTPLAGCRAICEHLQNRQHDPDGDRFLDSMHAELIRMSGLVNDLLDVARLHAGAAQWHWSTVDVTDACEQALESVRPLVDESQVELRLTPATDELMMRGDADATRRLVMNLASNAARFTERGRIEIRLDEAHGSDGYWVRIDVADTGSGIDDETAAKLGEAFSLSSGMLEHSMGSGAGLGLAICRGIATAHGGYLTVRSEPGVGTTFTAWLRGDLAEPASTSESDGIAFRQTDSAA